MGSCLVDIVVGWWVLESTTQQCACGCQSCSVHLEIVRRVNYVLSSGGVQCATIFKKKKEKNFIFPAHKQRGENLLSNSEPWPDVCEMCISE